MPAPNAYNDPRMQIASQLNQQAQARERAAEATASIERFDGYAAKAAQENPDINPNIFKDIAAAYRQNRPNIERDTYGLPRVQAEQNLAAHMERIHQQIGERYGAQGEVAWEIMRKKVKGPNMLLSMVNGVYDSDKGGVRVGGVLGAVAGLLMGLKIFNPGDWMGLFAIALSTGLGMWSGNKLSDGIQQMSAEKKLNFPLAKGQELSQNIQPEQAPNLQAALDAVRNPAVSPSQQPVQGLAVTHNDIKTFATSLPEAQGPREPFIA